MRGQRRQVDDLEEDALIARHVLELAAHPLSSLNPPPDDLPDQLDAVIESCRWHEEKLSRCTVQARHFDSRLKDIRLKHANLRADSIGFQTNKSSSGASTPRSSSGEQFNVHFASSKDHRTRLAPSVSERVLEIMGDQTAFLVFLLGTQLTGALLGRIEQHQTILTQFLGNKHEHPGADNLDEDGCAQGCRWAHGAFSYSKRPYSDYWWSEMNRTTWDWPRVRAHIEEMLQESRRTTMTAVDCVESSINRFVPRWFRTAARVTWSLECKMRPIYDACGGIAGGQPAAIMSWSKSEEEMLEEKEAKMRADRVALKRDGVLEKDIADSMIEEPDVCRIGERVIDAERVFDAYAPGEPSDAESRSMRSTWLEYWGYSQWLATYRSRNTGIVPPSPQQPGSVTMKIRKRGSRQP